MGVDEWLRLVYRNETWVTQLDGFLSPSDIPAHITDHRSGVPTSSSSLPGLVVSMWEQLEVSDGDRVLEIGTGTGYSTALGCHRLGDQNLTSVEVDPAIAARAKTSLETAGFEPRLLVGDGLRGATAGAPYDRVIATCAVRHIPPAWIAQCRPGAVILVTLSGWLHASGLARIVVTDPAAGLAEGRFIASDVSFMPARAQAPEFVIIPNRSEPPISERRTAVGPETVFSSEPERMVAQLAAPNCQYLPDVGDGLPEHLLVQSDDSYATFVRDASGITEWVVRQGGRRPIWDDIEASVLAWRSAGEPDLVDFHISVTPEVQEVSFDDQVAGRLPF